MKTYDNYRTALQFKRKPCAYVDYDTLTDNMKAITKEAKGKRIRIASKSIRSVSVLKEILRFSSVFQGVMCFTAEEAVYLSEQGLDDLLIAYPVWEEASISAVCQQVKRGAHIILMIDNEEHLQRIAMIAEQLSVQVPICLDIDMSSHLYGIHFGVHRSPLKTVRQVENIVRNIIATEHVVFDGIMGYEAQIAGVTDADPNQKLKNIAIRKLKRTSIKEVAKKRKKIMKKLNKLGVSLRFFNGGGTGSLKQTSEEKVITEVTVGSGFFNSHLFDKYHDFQLQPVAGFAIEITRMPEKDMYTCYGGGYVASGAFGVDKLPEIYLPQGATLTKNEGVGEVQTPVHYKGPIPLTYGDPIFLRHSKAGELCERFNELHIIQDDTVINTYTTYRGDGKCFL